MEKLLDEAEEISEKLNNKYGINISASRSSLLNNKIYSEEDVSELSKFFWRLYKIIEHCDKDANASKSSEVFLLKISQKRKNIYNEIVANKSYRLKVQIANSALVYIDDPSERGDPQAIFEKVVESINTYPPDLRSVDTLIFPGEIKSFLLWLIEATKGHEFSQENGTWGWNKNSSIRDDFDLIPTAIKDRLFQADWFRPDLFVRMSDQLHPIYANESVNVSDGLKKYIKEVYRSIILGNPMAAIALMRSSLECALHDTAHRYNVSFSSNELRDKIEIFYTAINKNDERKSNKFRKNAHIVRVSGNNICHNGSHDYLYQENHIRVTSDEVVKSDEVLTVSKLINLFVSFKVMIEIIYSKK